jgi:hypothetical protein
MIRWSDAYNRLKGNRQFASFFGGGQTPSIDSFRFIVYTTILPDMAASPDTDGGTFGQVVGPLNQNFPSGAVILGITAAAWQNYEACSDATPGRRDRFGIALTYSGDEQITANGLTLAESLLGSGRDTILPAKELMIPPSQSILVSGASLVPSAQPAVTAHVAFHCMVRRSVG